MSGGAHLRRLRLGSLVDALLHRAEARGRDGPVLLAVLVLLHVIARVVALADG